LNEDIHYFFEVVVFIDFSKKNLIGQLSGCPDFVHWDFLARKVDVLKIPKKSGCPENTSENTFSIIDWQKKWMP